MAPPLVSGFSQMVMIKLMFSCLFLYFISTQKSKWKYMSKCLYSVDGMFFKNEFHFKNESSLLIFLTFSIIYNFKKTGRGCEWTERGKHFKSREPIHLSFHSWRVYVSKSWRWSNDNYYLGSPAVWASCHSKHDVRYVLFIEHIP